MLSIQPITSKPVIEKNIYKLVIPASPVFAGDMNAYLVVEDNIVTLVDIGPKTKKAWVGFTTQLEQAGFSINDIDQIILTHHHADHCGLLDILLEMREIPVMAHPLALPWVTRDQGFFQSYGPYFADLYRRMGVSDELIKKVIQQSYQMYEQFSCGIHLSESLSEGKPIPGMRGWEVLETPGHASSHLVFYKEADGVILAGDLIMKDTPTIPFIEPPIIPGKKKCSSMIQLRESLLKCRELKVKTTLSGHGMEADNWQKIIDFRLQEHERRAEKVRNWLLDKPLTAFQLSQRLFPKSFNKKVYPTICETIALLDLLLERKQITFELSSGVDIYQLI